MEKKNGQAEIRIGSRVITIPLHDELVTYLQNAEGSLKVDVAEMIRFLRGYLPDRTQPVFLKIKDIEIDFDIPSWMAEALEVEATPPIMEDLYIDDFGQLVRKMIPSDIRPPSEKQLTFAKKIAKVLGKELSAEYLSSVTLCSEFIDRHLSEFQEKQLSLRTFHTFSRKAARGYAAFYLLSASGEVGDSLLDALQVSRKETIGKYLADFRQFVTEYPTMEPEHQSFSLDAINEFLRENYEHLQLPDLNECAISWLLQQKDNAK